MRTILAASSARSGAEPAWSAALALAGATGADLRRQTIEDATTKKHDAAMADPDLVVVSPRMPPWSGSIHYDPAATSIVRNTPSAVLVVRQSAPWKVHRVSIPVTRVDLQENTLSRAAHWIANLRGPRQPPKVPIEISILHVATSPDEMLEDRERLREHIHELENSQAAPARVRLVRCVRWGSAVARRILLWLGREQSDLLILRRVDVRSGPASPDAPWLDVLGASPCSVLLLPRHEPQVAKPSPVVTSRSAVPVLFRIRRKPVSGIPAPGW